MQSIYEIQVTGMDGRVVSLSEFRGQVLLIVNVASRCSFTPQYRDLESLHRDYHSQGFSVLGFPCNQFLAQEPGSNEEIVEFCTSRYDVTFPMFAKIEVNGPNAHPLYEFLKQSQSGWLGVQRIGWNFSKFLVDRQGLVAHRFSSFANRKSIEPQLRRLLAVTKSLDSSD
jgi:glutathione peroxidase